MKESAFVQRGFTLIEAIVILGITAVLFVISVTALSRPQSQSSVETLTTTLVSELKQQQLLSMMGDSGSQPTAQSHGIRIESSRYTTFTGSSFATSTDQYAVDLPADVTFSYSPLPLEIVFNKRSGETTPITSLVIGNVAGDQKVVSINRLGGITVN